MRDSDDGECRHCFRAHSFVSDMEEREIQRTIRRAPEVEEMAAIPRICGTCRKWDPGQRFCLMWETPTEDAATCLMWAMKEDL